jgi:serine phosphatase RsbU (regulator of sigma subunit)
LQAQNEEQSSLLLRLQETLLDIPQELPGVKFAHLYRSATQQAKVGGDFYDVFEARDGRIGLLIGDVSGHGVEAARIAALVKDTVHAFAHQFRRPHLVLRETNRLLVEKKMPGFVTAFLGFLDSDTGRFVYSSAGHPPPLIAVDGRIALLESIGSPLGVFADARYGDSETDIEEGSLLLFYTDGITEARREGELFGEERLTEALKLMCAGAVDTLPALLLEEALFFSGGRLEDDAALLAVNYLGKTGDKRPSGRA